MFEVDPGCGCSIALTENACKLLVVRAVCQLNSVADSISDWIPMGLMKYWTGLPGIV